MPLFNPQALFKVLILWAGAQNKPSALALRDNLLKVTPSGYEIRVINEGHDDARYDAASEEAIDTADCVLMVASADNWKTADSAIREREYFNKLARANRKHWNQFRFVRLARRDCPSYESSGLRALSFEDARSISEREANTALEYLATIRATIGTTGGKPPPAIKLSKESLAKPNGLLDATLWLVTLDDGMLTSADTENQAASSRRLVAALRRLKALHSVHSEIGAMIREPMKSFQQEPPSACSYDVGRIRNDFVNYLGAFRLPHSGRLEAALRDCIEFGLLPTLTMLSRRLTSMPAFGREMLFVEAAIERLSAIVADRDEPGSGFAEEYDGSWWVSHYDRCSDLAQSSFRRLISDLDIAELLIVTPGSNEAERRFADTAQAAANLLAATLQLTFLIIVIFSFLHAHKRAVTPDLTPSKIEDAIEQIAADWRDGELTDALVKWSNQMILHVLAATESDGEPLSAAA